jgi:hypothetical protein
VDEIIFLTMRPRNRIMLEWIENLYG